MWFHHLHSSHLVHLFSPSSCGLFTLLVLAVISSCNSLDASYLHEECSSKRQSVTCIALDDSKSKSDDEDSCNSNNNCNVFAKFSVSSENMTMDEIRLSLYRFGDRARIKHTISLRIGRNSTSNRYFCKFNNGSVDKSLKRPPNEYKVLHKVGYADAEMFGCHWIIDHTLHQDLWPRKGSNGDLIDLVTDPNVPFELRSHNVSKTIERNFLPLYKLQHLTHQDCDRRHKYCYHWKEFGDSWLIAQYDAKDESFLHILMIVSVNFSSVELKFSKDTNFGDDFVVTCSKTRCNQSIFHDTYHMVNREAIIKDVQFRTDDWLHRIHFKIPLWFTVEGCSFSLSEAFYINFKIVRGIRSDTIWLDAIDLNLNGLEKRYHGQATKSPQEIPLFRLNSSPTPLYRYVSGLVILSVVTSVLMKAAVFGMA